MNTVNFPHNSKIPSLQGKDVIVKSNGIRINKLSVTSAVRHMSEKCNLLDDEVRENTIEGYVVDTLELIELGIEGVYEEREPGQDDSKVWARLEGANGYECEILVNDPTLHPNERGMLLTVTRGEDK